MSKSVNTVSKFCVGVLILFIMGLNISFSQTTIDYQSLVATGSSSDLPIGYGYHDLSAYTAHGLVWVFYSDGTDAVYRTKQAEEGGNWSASQIIFNEGSGRDFNVAFDGEYFHFIHETNGDLNYMRGRALVDGKIQFDNEVIAYSNSLWDASNRHFSITVDHRYNPWIILKVINGDQRKPILLSSIASDGTWQDRPGFPKDLDLSSSGGDGAHGRAPNIMEIEENKILTVFRQQRDNFRMVGRIWTGDSDNPDDEGDLGEIENTTLPNISSRASFVSTEDGIVLANSQINVARRNTDGSWVDVSPGGLTDSFNNTLTIYSGAIRMWDLNDGNIRYKETTNNGDNWGDLVVKWSDADIQQFNASQAKGSHGDHHSVLWVTGTGETFDPPFDVYMGIVGTVPPPPAPSLVYPDNEDIDVPIEVTLRWSEIAAAASYDVQVSDESNFSTTVIDEVNVTDTSVTVSGLDIDTIYYWRVRSVTSQETRSEWSDIWSFTTVGIPPAPVLLLPEDGSTDESTSLILSWEPIKNVDNYQLQISTQPDFSTLFLDNDNITESMYQVNGLDYDRTYYWQVRAMNEFGVGDWSEVWSFTTKIGVPPAPVLVIPENNATNQPITLTFEWEEADLADTYRFQLSKVSDFSSTVINVGNITETSYEVSDLEHSQTYYWRVNATNESGTSGWSSVWGFTTIIEKPAIPQLTSPINEAEGVSTKPELDWEEAARAETYRLQVATDDEFTSVVLEVDDAENSSYTVIEELDEFTTHYWRVIATNIGGTSDWSDVWEFTTGQAFPIAPTLVSPEDGSTDQETSVLFLWNSVPTATHYRLQVSVTNDFSDTVIDEDEITNTFYTASGLDYDTEYYWRLRAVSGVGAGDWSAVWSFTTTDDVTSVDRLTGGIPTEFSLDQNYPNPFNPITTIRFGLPLEATVYLEVYNMLGQRVATLISGEHYTAGTYEAVWDARDDTGRSVSSGMYIYRISAGDYVNVRKLLLMK